MSTFDLGSVNGKQKINGVERRVLGGSRRPGGGDPVATIRSALWELVAAILDHADDGTDLNDAEWAARAALAALDGDHPDREAVDRLMRTVSDSAGQLADVTGAAVRVQRLLGR